ncbi:MAG: TolB family protein [Planctomycetota bacterium]|jgi:hypothetical protein
MKARTALSMVILCAIIHPTTAISQSTARKTKSPLDELPDHIALIAHFGQRSDFSHDSKRLLGYTRALYLSNGDILLSGAREFNAAKPWPSRREKAELWVLKKDLSTPPVPLGEKCSEGPAVSRRQMRIAWTIDHGNYPDRLPKGATQIWMADVIYENGRPKLDNKKMVLDSRKLPFKTKLETQNFRPPDDTELIFSAYRYKGTEVMGLNLKTGKVTNYSNAPRYFDEPEGIFPDGKFTTVEGNQHLTKKKSYKNIDLYKLALDGSGKTTRLTFFNDYPNYAATNPVVSDDGKLMAFQMEKVDEPAGVGKCLLIYDFAKAGK